MRLWTIVVACSDFDRSIGDMAVFWVVVQLLKKSTETAAVVVAEKLCENATERPDINCRVVIAHFHVVFGVAHED